ncbi:peptidylprolyl isomerase [Polyangium spumosum]|uniref:Peptidyl-prolyl cis-trans isomerase n=1 Tax=Polyangium spumosum TaxID=889282 RepID=A0A6N7PLK8_9BACT|nr:peptidylprolyl isomerase [Polyangium spumosum]MRG92667.1 peptidyl-prolyl cis-trans isomerase [Polyangium spumosum]
MLVRRALSSLFVAAIVALSAGCNDKAVAPPAADAAAPAAGLSPEQATRTLAKVGDRVITLGDFAATLERMDQFDRLRYQTKERRKELLDEIIDVELLAAEAKRRGLDKQPETEEAIRQILRDAILADARKGLPAPGEIPPAEVRAYYEAHVEQFREPERRRVAAIVLSDRKTAARVLEDATKIKTAAEWGELFQKHSMTAPKVKDPNTSLDLAGDLGVVGAPDDPRGKNPKIPEPIRAAVFKIPSVGSVLDEIVEAEGRFYVVRMNGITAAHSRTLQEADRSIRVKLLQQKIQEREKALEADLRKKFPVEIDDAALGKVKLPEGVKPYEGKGADPWTLPGQEAADGGAGDAGSK